MHAAQDAAGEPLAMRQRLHRRIGRGHRSVEECVEVGAGDGHHPEQEERGRAEMIERVVAVAEGAVEHVLDQHEPGTQYPFQQRDHCLTPGCTGARIARITTTMNNTPPMIATRPPRPITPMPAISDLLRSTCSAPATLRCTP